MNLESVRSLPVDFSTSFGSPSSTRVDDVKCSPCSQSPEQSKGTSSDEADECWGVLSPRLGEELKAPSLQPVGRQLCRQFAKRFADVLYVMGASGAVCYSAQTFIVRTCSHDDDGVFARKAKLFCESFSARLFGTDEPSALPDGAFGRWIRSQLGWSRRNSSKVTHIRVALAESIFACKVLMGHATERMRIQSLDAHRHAVKNSRPDNSSVEVVFWCIKPVIDKMAFNLREKFETLHMTVPASSKGSNQSGGGLQGKAGWLVRSYHGVRKTGNPLLVAEAWAEREEEPLLLPIKTVDGYADLLAGVGRDRDVRFDHSAYDPDPSPDFGCLIEEPQVKVKLDFTPSGHFAPVREVSYPATEAKFQGHVVQEAVGEFVSGKSRIVRVSAVMEYSMKVRTVTKSTAAAATVTTWWQQALFDEMKRLPCFPSLSRKISIIDVMRVTDQMEKDGLIASSDFKSATDLLNPRLTNMILTRLCSDCAFSGIIMDDNADKLIEYAPEPCLWTPNLLQDLRVTEDYRVKKLIGSRGRGSTGFAYYEDIVGTRWALWDRLCSDDAGMAFDFGGDIRVLLVLPRTAKKTCGQLMGQATSFPLLCLVNAGCSIYAAGVAAGYWTDFESCLSTSPDMMAWAVSEDGGDLLSKFIVNGDDRLAATTAAGEVAFWSAAKPIGLNRSPGKSHESNRFCVINGQRYSLRFGDFVRCPVLRPHLFFGIKKLQGELSRAPEVITACFEACPRQWEVRATRLFRSRQGQSLSDFSMKMPLSLPVALGGWGQELPSCWSEYLTNRQLFIADQLLRSMPFMDFDYGPVFPEIRMSVEPSQIWDLPTSRNGTEEVKSQQAEAVYAARLRKEAEDLYRDVNIWECHLCFVRTHGKSKGSCRCCGEPRRHCSKGINFGNLRFCLSPGCECTPEGYDRGVLTRNVGKEKILRDFDPNVEVIRSAVAPRLTTLRRRDGFGKPVNRVSTDCRWTDEYHEVRESLPIGLARDWFAKGLMALPLEKPGGEFAF